MKIQCDVCNNDEASFFCVADEAALCEGCDHRVHHANKLAGKHQRFSLIQPLPKEVPLCDICQERRAFLFCQQDRAILCKECDIPIHKANEYTQKHNRFLLTGIKVSATSALYSSSSSSTVEAASSAESIPNCSDSLPHLKVRNPKEKPVALGPSTQNHHSVAKTTSTFESIVPQPITTDDKGGGNGHQLAINAGDNITASSISEYLIKTLPGWHVEDLLDSSYSNGFCKSGDGDLLPFWNADLESNMSSFPPENMGIWVPQAPPLLHPTQMALPYASSNIGFGGQIGFKDSKEVAASKPSREWRDDNCFAVPQISPSSVVSKRSRLLW